MADLDRAAECAAKNRDGPRLVEADVRRRQLIGQLVAIRLENRLTQSDVGREMGVSQSVIADIESAKFDVRYTTLDRYACAASHGSAHLVIVRQPGSRTVSRAGRMKQSA